MGTTFGLHPRWLARTLILLAGLPLLLGSIQALQPAASASTVRVIVQGVPGALAQVEGAVEALGGVVLGTLPIIDGVVAELPATAVGDLEEADAVGGITPDGKIVPQGDEWDDDGDGDDGDGDDGDDDDGDDDDGDDDDNDGDADWADDDDDDVPVVSPAVIAHLVGANELWADGITGSGVGVALIDTGVVPVEGLTVGGKVVNGPDLSFESQDENVLHLDTYGHGTHMAGIIAGRHSDLDDLDDLEEIAEEDLEDLGDEDALEDFVGVAPGAHLVNVKVAAADGAVDVSQVIAAIDWVVQHRDDNGLNIRVLNLSFGTDSTQDHRLDPLSYAVEVAWRKGIVVVVAAGNDGSGSSRLNNPAVNPFVMAVGASDHNGTLDPSDDTLADFSSRGDSARRPDLVAPGRSVVSLRNPGSFADEQHPGARVEDDFFRGSGTSQAAAVISGAAALLLEQRPELTPDQVKALLTSTAAPLARHDPGAGAGSLDVAAASEHAAPSVTQAWEHGTGLGSLDAARGSQRVADGGVEISGEQDIFGGAWDGRSWSEAAWNGRSWSGGEWNGRSWSGSSWSGRSWSGRSWSGRSWSGRSWSGRSWSGRSWSGRSWSGRSWSGGSWSGQNWTGRSWSGRSWSAAAWGT